jgi:hypothetical protein
MGKKLCILLIFPILFLVQCKNQEKKDMEQKRNTFIKQETVDKVTRSLIEKYGKNNQFRIERGVSQVADFWTAKDGKPEEFELFCLDNFINEPAELTRFFNRLSENFELIYGLFNQLSLKLKWPLHVDGTDLLPIDEIFGAYSPYAHLSEDFFSNKIAFNVVLNFPTYSLKEKKEMGTKWSRLEWAYARMGDVFTSRVPAEEAQFVSDAMTKSETYISNYNICMGYLVNAKMDTFFPKNMVLISHWGLRDELKSNYSKEGLVKQKMIYEVMKRIILQEIPDSVINNKNFQWDPYANKIYKDGKEQQFKPEPDTRYLILLNNFKAMKKIDPYSPAYPTYIQRKFDAEMELSQAEVEKLFTDYVSSPTVKQVAQLITKRLGRNLEPFDIWYDGFKPRSNINQDELTQKVRKLYPNKDAFEKDFPNILIKLGFKPEKAQSISSKIAVDAARGSGHAWGAQMKGDKAHLRTRIHPEGMDYKGYNIAIHEFGHNVEQTVSLYDVDYYLMAGVPSTAFTEALAFNFQKRDLELLGIKNEDKNKSYLEALDHFWATYEIMGVSLVDMNVWKWLYANPDATPEQLKKATIEIAIEVWNKYYAPVFGIKDQPILAIYSHMIDNPLYLSAYPIGHLIELQLSQYFDGKNFAEELQRIYTQGRLIPQLWMKNAVGSEISINGTIDLANTALKNIK